MVAVELRERNQQAIASPSTGEALENTQADMTKGEQHESPVGNADKDQHNAYGADREAYRTIAASGFRQLHDRGATLKYAICTV